jgi:hypothetical protein
MFTIHKLIWFETYGFAKWYDHPIDVLEVYYPNICDGVARYWLILIPKIYL